MISKNITKFYFYRIFTSFNLVLPIFVLFLINNGLSLTQVFVLQSVYTLTLVILNIPTGAFADRYGRKKSLIISSFVLLTAFFVYGSSTRFWHFLIAEILYGISTAFWLSQGTSFIYDTLKQIGDEHKYKRVQGKVETINSLGMCLGSLIAGVIAAYSMRWNYYIGMIPVFIGLLISFSFRETRIQQSKEKYFEKIRNAFDYAVKHPQLRFFMLFSSIVDLIMFTGFIFAQPYLESLGADTKIIGAVFSVCYILTAVGAYKANWLEGKIKEIFSIYLVISLVALTMFIYYLTNSLAVASFAMILGGAVRGFYIVVIYDYLHRHMTSERRSTLMSLQLFMGDTMIAVLSPFFGWFADLYSIKATLLLCSGILALFMFAMFFIYPLEMKIIGRKRYHETG